uniref:Uncharacterized protein n=1 Tax=Corvus moneduloides TaxID=1196302 RepID=A0A8C3EWI4_CORMO
SQITGKTRVEINSDKVQKKYWKWKHSPKNEDEYVVTSDAELDVKLMINLGTMSRYMSRVSMNR